MDNEATIIIDLWKLEEGISAKANIQFQFEIDEKFTFYIAEDFIIDEIHDGNNTVVYDYSSEKLEFRAATKKIEIILSGSTELFISYHGKVNSWHTLYEENILAINYYTAWYPTDLPMNTRYTVRLHLDDSYHVVNGKYDYIEKMWYYHPLDNDVNIIALRNYEIMQSDNVSLYYFGKAYKHVVSSYFDNYNRIVDYYTELYGNNKADKTSIVILPKGNKYDGYLRKALIVFGGIREDYDGIVHILAHEIAHSWCQGADAASWEDWLNETFAEWSALLYELEATFNINKFNEIIFEKERRFQVVKPVKTKDLSRPEGVHDNGVLHLYKLYCTYGKEAIKRILREFDSLKEKTTDNLISKLKKSEETAILSEYISDMIKTNN